ncbi:D-isomer specific 2-hydroxyacid dehydrogenase NAD-binding protein [Syntrophobacter sp. SbD1]|nr:D-isomer specific 2-hydroxyacid dehydrogenase NAD-binding protein [Syntrophobacter sp. SbD1]
MSEVLVSHNIRGSHRQILKEIFSGMAEVNFLPETAKEDRIKVIERAEVIISWDPVRELSAEELMQAGRVRLIQLITAGAEHLRFELLPSGAVIASNPGAFSEPMAEHILGMAFALAKRLCVNHAKLRQGKFDQRTNNRDLRGAVFGVLGFGGIGQAAARLMRAVGLSIFAINSSGQTGETVDFIGTLDDLDFLLQQSDVFLVSIPLTLRTRGLIGARELAVMKPDAILINVARGAIIDEESLYRHLAQNPGFSAGIDAWWAEPSMGGGFKVNYPFFDLPNFLGSPHNSSITAGTMAKAIRLAAQNAADFLSGEKVRGIVKKEDYVKG